jgi:AraC-like DNA-binding protein
MRLTEDLTRCETIPDWARHLCAADSAAMVASFGHVVVQRVNWAEASEFVPPHDVLDFCFVGEGGAVAKNEAERHFASILQIGAEKGQRAAQGSPLPSLRVIVDREHFDAVVAEHFAGEALPTVQSYTFMRGTPHGRGLYALADSLRHMVEMRTDLLSRYCLEIALIKAIALAPPSMTDLKHRGETWGPMLRRVEQAAMYLRHHLEAPFQLAAVAAAVQCSERTLNDGFQRCLNLTPLQFHRLCRLEAAYADLSEAGASVTEVATKYGFENMGRFAKAFRERFGINPSEVPKS